ncbi:LEAF RUST 10 DISEASE-RESISTANCE LOCUS RECEPTOR-LIKE PROTEIN KINASE-like 1.1 [Telopea speciosissima]|uniref:LEAF RUST 10 DISEASE-RESISTANCE LOCUS RECEPTOR-LIKE PROTEIN KINASE-like 1.1 n=1 Tax=Telopea speciosissima TaxID=54955 RepID=UPI001CC579A1|nr:LEAF RUST 10 DISEASE-RESISTANCE LOCUS RECEPTOR-LIKE PROTEIN KINASE-like 1.1 [Telopea speciosissima]
MMGGDCSICFPFINAALFVNNLNVALIPLFLIRIFLQLPIIISAATEDEQFSYCCGQAQFCGNLNISYPFFNDNWGCGLERLHCINVSIPVINSWDDQNCVNNNMYEVHSIDYTNKTLLAHYLRFTQADLLNDNERCKFLFNNFTTMGPTFFHHLSAQVISPNLTLRVCINGSPNTDYCKVEAIPADVTTADAPAPLPPSSTTLDNNQSSPPYDCKLVHLPVDVVPTTFQYGPVDHVSQLFTVGFRLRWILPQLCNQCEENGTFCVSYDDESFFCSNPKDRIWNSDQGKKTQSKIIGIGIPVGVAAGILLTSIFFYIIYKYRTEHNRGVLRTFSLKTDLGKGSSHFGIPIFSYAELEEATNNFSSVNVLGDGGSATVYHGKLQDGRVVAIKRLYNNNYKHVERFMNEIEILTCLRHRNLVTLHGCTSYRSQELLLVYEFIPNGTVADHLHGDRRKVGSLPWPVRMSIAIETASALSYLHASDIIHRDVKTSNILLDNHFHVKVADFGLCRLFPTDASYVSTAPQGTPGYVDPEYHRSYQLTDKSDVYSFGVVLIELISSKPAIDTSRHRDEINLANMAMKKIQKGALQELVDPCLGFESDHATRRIVTLVAELAFRCLQHEKELRPSMDEVLEILMVTRGEEYKVDNPIKVMDINLASYDDEQLPKNIPPPPASPDYGTQKLISPSTTPSTNG